MNVIPQFLMTTPKGNDAVTNEPAVPVAPRMPARQSVPYSEVAARAAQHVHDLQMTIEAQQAEIHALTARLTVADERARVVQKENEFLMHDRDYHKERCVKIETKLNSAAQLILDCMDSTTKTQEPPQITLTDLNVDAPEPKKNGKRKNGDTPSDGDQISRADNS